MENLNMIPKKMSNTKLKMLDLNPHLMCVLCGGYYIDATTIVECLHSFCRSCIVKHLESSKYCPICEVQVHKTKPLMNIRPDETLQNIVYKLVPGLFASEMRNRRKFYKERPHYIKPYDSESAGEIYGEVKIYVNDENITFSLVYHVGSVPTNLENSYKEVLPPAQNEKRYFKCPTGVTIYHLKKLIRAKFELSESNYKLEIFYKDQVLHEDFTLLDVSYIYLWKKKGSLDLTFKIYENTVKRQKMDDGKDATLMESLKEPEISMEPCSKEQESIVEPEKSSETPGKMAEKNEEVTEEKKNQVNDEIKMESGKIAESSMVEESVKMEERAVVEKAAVVEEGAKIEKSTKVEESAKVDESKKNEESVKIAENPKPEVSSAKENGTANDEAKEVQLQISESGVMSVSQVDDRVVVRTMEETAAKVAKNQIVTGLGVNNGVKEKEEVRKPQEVAKRPPPEKKPPSKSGKIYKTIRCAPKTWHPVIPKEKLRPTLMKNSDEPKRPPKFFKMRNMPRFLGNPSSGVKPMYAESRENNAQEKKPEEKKLEAAKSLNKILKIDPKTLRPIEKDEIKVTPNTPNLLTNPFIPNNNHFLFSDLHLLPPNAGNFSTSGKQETKNEKPSMGGFKSPMPNGTYPPICFPTPDHSAGFYPFSNLSKSPTFPFPPGDKMDPLLRATRLSPFGNLAGFNVAGFHASLPPSISRLLNPQHHFRKISQSLEKKNKEESTKDSSKSCDVSLKVSKTNEKDEKSESKGEGKSIVGTEVKERRSQSETKDERKAIPKKEEAAKEKKEEVNGESSESASKTGVEFETKREGLSDKDKDKDKDRDR